MKISIVILNKNFGNYLEETLQNILSQDYNNFEVIVIDAASNDNSVDILKKYHDKIKWISEPDSGHGEGAVKGILMASGDIVTLQSADDIMYPETISYVAEFFNKIDKKIAGIYGLVSAIDQNGNHISTGRTAEILRIQYNKNTIHEEVSKQNDENLKQNNFEYNFIDLITRKIVLPTNAVFFRKDIFMMCDYVDLKQLPVCPDYRIWLEMGLKAPFVPINRYFCKTRKQLKGANINPKNIPILQNAYKKTMHWFFNENNNIPNVYKNKVYKRKLDLRIMIVSATVWQNVSISKYLNIFTFLIIKKPNIIYYWPNHFKNYFKELVRFIISSIKLSSL